MIVWVYLHSIFLRWPSKDASFLQQSAYRLFKVIQGHWFWHQSKVHTAVTPSLGMNPFEFLDEFFIPKTSPWAICRWRFRDPSLGRFHSVPACDGRTDRQTSRRWLVQGLHSRAMLTLETDRNSVLVSAPKTTIWTVSARFIFGRILIYDFRQSFGFGGKRFRFFRRSAESSHCSNVICE